MNREPATYEGKATDVGMSPWQSMRVCDGAMFAYCNFPSQRTSEWSWMGGREFMHIARIAPGRCNWSRRTTERRPKETTSTSACRSRRWTCPTRRAARRARCGGRGAGFGAEVAHREMGFVLSTYSGLPKARTPNRVASSRPPGSPRAAGITMHCHTINVLLA